MTCLYCDDTYWAIGLCRHHWQRWQKRRPMEAPRRYHQLDKKGWIANKYRWISTERGEIQEHRYVMENYLGRKLETDECVHHKNGNKLDNRLENLEVVARDKHTSLHRPKRKPCQICGMDDPHQSRGFCSKHTQQLKRGTLVI